MTRLCLILALLVLPWASALAEDAGPAQPTPAQPAPASTPADAPATAPAPALPRADVPPAAVAPEPCGHSTIEPILTIEFARDHHEALCLATARPKAEMLAWLRFDQRIYLPVYATLLGAVGLYLVRREGRLPALLGGCVLLATLWGSLADGLENLLTAELLHRLQMSAQAGSDDTLLRLTDEMWRVSLAKWLLVGVAVALAGLGFLARHARLAMGAVPLVLAGLAMAASPFLGSANLGSMAALGGMFLAVAGLALLCYAALTLRRSS